MNDTTLETIFLEAIDNFSYPNMQKTGCTQGELEVDHFDDIEYSEEFTFDAGMICDIPIEGGGWIDCRREEGITSISGIFVLVKNRNWQQGRILPEGEYLQGYYDLEKKTWSFTIDMI